MIIKDPNSSKYIEIIKIKSEEDFIVKVSDEKLTCEANVYGYMSEQIVDFFKFIKTNWKGWEGDKIWGSLEGEFTLVATSDTAGHVELKFTLQRNLYDSWSLTSTINLEASQLDLIYEEISVIF